MNPIDWIIRTIAWVWGWRGRRRRSQALAACAELMPRFDALIDVIRAVPDTRWNGRDSKPPEGVALTARVDALTNEALVAVRQLDDPVALLRFEAAAKVRDQRHASQLLQRERLERMRTELDRLTR